MVYSRSSRQGLGSFRYFQRRRVLIIGIGIALSIGCQRHRDITSHRSYAKPVHTHLCGENKDRLILAIWASARSSACNFWKVDWCRQWRQRSWRLNLHCNRRLRRQTIFAQNLSGLHASKMYIQNGSPAGRVHLVSQHQVD